MVRVKAITAFAANPQKIGPDRLMKSLILAGGYATRLRPLSCSKPKLLFPVVGTPLIDYMIDWLMRGNISGTVLAVNHLSDKLRMEVAARKLGDKITVSVEETPLGTGGPLSLAAPLLAGEEQVVVVNGDVVSDIDIKNMAEAHVESKAEATIAVFKVRDTRAFGLVTLDSNNRVVGFEEKFQNKTDPGWINAGVYLLNQNVIERIPKRRAVSLEREIFPSLARENKLMGWRHEGFWYDIGKIRDYVRANMELLPRLGNGLIETERIAQGIEAPSHIGENYTIERDSKLGPRAILSRNVKVMSGAIVHDSIVFEDSVLSEGCHVEGSVIGEGTTVGKNAIVGKDSVVAGEVRIADGAVLNPGSVVLN